MVIGGLPPFLSFAHGKSGAKVSVSVGLAAVSCHLRTIMGAQPPGLLPLIVCCLLPMGDA